MTVSEKRRAQVCARYEGRPCALCGLEDGSPVQLVADVSFTENNVLAIGPLCQELLRRRERAAVDAVRLIVHNDDARYRLLADRLDFYYPATSSGGGAA